MTKTYYDIEAVTKLLDEVNILKLATKLLFIRLLKVENFRLAQIY